jgi:carboxypeptidase family protein
MLFALAAVLTATVIATEPRPSADSARGAVAGMVRLTDAHGEAFDAPGTQLTLTCDASRNEPQVTTSDDHGKFRFVDVPSGPCSLRAELPGFEPAASAIVVRRSQGWEADIHLEVVPIGTGLQVAAASTCSWHSRRFN